MQQLRRAVPRRGHLRLLRRQGDRHQPRAADPGQRPVHRRPVGRQVPQDRDLPGGHRHAPPARCSASCAVAPPGSSCSRATPAPATSGPRSTPAQRCRWSEHRFADRWLNRAAHRARHRRRQRAGPGDRARAGRRRAPRGARRAPTASRSQQTADLLGPDCRIGDWSTSPTRIRSPRWRRELADEEISILVNNAGVAGPVKPLVEIEPAEWDDVFAVNVRGMFLMCRAFLPPMIERGTRRRHQPRVGQRQAAAGAADAVHRVEDGGDRADDDARSRGRPGRGAGQQPVARAGARRADGPQLPAGGPAAAASPSARPNEAFAGRATLGRLVEESEVGDAVVAMLAMTGLHCADIDLSAGMVAR